MTDIKSKVERSKNMSAIRCENTKPEEIVRKFLFSHGFRYRKNDPRYPGKPDIVLPKYRTVIFVNGCFWHMHGCRKSKIPTTRRDFWEAKLKANVDRDIANKAKLEKMGWHVMTVWECELSPKPIRERNLLRLCEDIKLSYEK